MGIMGTRDRHVPTYCRGVPRLFIAVWPPDAVLRELAAMPRPVAKGLRWTKPERLHVTLRFLGQCDEAEVRDALAAAGLPAATATLGPRIERLGRGVLMVPIEGLDELATAVEAAIAPLGLPPPGHAFTGHLTVARFKRKLPPDCRPTLKASFPVTEISLVRTEPSGAYTTVERYGLS